MRAALVLGVLATLALVCYEEEPGRESADDWMTMFFPYFVGNACLQAITRRAWGY